MKLSTPICKLPALHRSMAGRYKWPKVEEAWKHFFPGVDYIEQHRGADDAMHEALIVLKLYRMGIMKMKKRVNNDDEDKGSHNFT